MHQVYSTNKSELFVSKNLTKKVVGCAIFCFKLFFTPECIALEARNVDCRLWNTLGPRQCV